MACSYKQFKALSCLSELTPIHQKCRSKLYMAPSIKWNTPINLQKVGLSTKIHIFTHTHTHTHTHTDRGDIPTTTAELRAACVSSVQSGIMHNAPPQLLTAGAHQIIYTCFHGHEELIFEAVPNEIPLGPNSILRERSGFLLGIRCILIMQNTGSFNSHMWILVSSLFYRKTFIYQGALTPQGLSHPLPKQCHCQSLQVLSNRQVHQRASTCREKISPNSSPHSSPETLLGP